MTKRFFVFAIATLFVLACSDDKNRVGVSEPEKDKSASGDEWITISSTDDLSKINLAKEKGSMGEYHLRLLVKRGFMMTRATPGETADVTLGFKATHRQMIQKGNPIDKVEKRSASHCTVSMNEAKVDKLSIRKSEHADMYQLSAGYYPVTFDNFYADFYEEKMQSISSWHVWVPEWKDRSQDGSIKLGCTETVEKEVLNLAGLYPAPESLAELQGETMELQILKKAE